MPMEYLLGLAQDELPLIESDVASIDKLRLLHAAGLVEVRFPPVDSIFQTAQVLYITGLGCATLRAGGGVAAGPVICPQPPSDCDLEPSFD